MSDFRKRIHQELEPEIGEDQVSNGHQLSPLSTKSPKKKDQPKNSCFSNYAVDRNQLLDFDPENDLDEDPFGILNLSEEDWQNQGEHAQHPPSPTPLHSTVRHSQDSLLDSETLEDDLPLFDNNAQPQKAFVLDLTLDPKAKFVDSMTLQQMRDVLTDVFKELDIKDILSCSLVCRLFALAVQNSLLWKSKLEPVLAIKLTQPFELFVQTYEINNYDINNGLFLIPRLSLDAKDSRWKKLSVLLCKHLENLRGTIRGVRLPLSASRDFQAMGDMLASNQKQAALSFYSLALIAGLGSSEQWPLRTKKASLFLQLKRKDLAKKQISTNEDVRALKPKHYYHEIALIQAQILELEDNPKEALRRYYEAYSTLTGNNEAKKDTIKKKLQKILKIVKRLEIERENGYNFCSNCETFYEPLLKQNGCSFDSRSAKFVHQSIENLWEKNKFLF